MARTDIFSKIKDSNASPYITQKDVIMCRSGMQYYHASEVQSYITEDNKPPKEKEWYREYRPANIVVRAKSLCSNLPVTKEHPDEFVNPDNFQDLVGGITDKEVEVVALDGEAEGEIGLKTNLTFYTKELYEYYKEHKEVSLGYTVKKHFVSNPEEVGYDILLDEITEVNHLAITRSGRGGSSVAVIDSIIGGMKPMRTGIFAWLKSKKVKDSAEKFSFGKEVFGALHSSKGNTEEELAKELKGVFDSCAELKDCPQKATMLDMIRDCYDNKEKALANEEELTATFDSMYVSISGDSLKEIADAIKSVSGGGAVGITDSKDEEEEKPADEGKKDKAEDSDEEGKEEDSDEEGKGDEAEDSDEEGKGKDGCAQKDSLPLTKEDVAKIVKDSMGEELKDFIVQTVKDTLGIKGDKPKMQGEQLDSKPTPVIERDYSEFLE